MAVNADLYLDRTIAGITLLPENRGSSIGDDLPTINNAEYGLFGATIADALRCVRRRALEPPARAAHAKAS